MERRDLVRAPDRRQPGPRAQQLAARLPLARRRQDVRAAGDHPGAAGPRHPRPELLRHRQAAAHQGDHPAAGLRAARRGRGLDLGRDRTPRTAGTGRRCDRSGRRAGASGGSKSSAACTTRPPTRTATCGSCSTAPATACAGAPGPQIYGVSADTPLETELVVQPVGQAHARPRAHRRRRLELLGNQGRLRTKVCWAQTPFRSFSCPQELHGVRLDGAVAWWWGKRLFVVARKHLRGPTSASARRSTSSPELRGRAALDPRVGRAAQRGRHLVRRRGAARGLAFPRDLVLEPAGRRPELAGGLPGPDRHLAGHAGPVEAAFSGFSHRRGPAPAHSGLSGDVRSPPRSLELRGPAAGAASRQPSARCPHR